MTLLSRCSLFVTLVVGLSNVSHAGITFTAFGAFGQGGIVNGQTLTFGNGGEIFEIDSFIKIGGVDLNGPVLGTSAQLSLDPLPPGLTFAFTSTLSPDSTDLRLQYSFTNTSAASILDVQFFSFIDPQIDDPFNTYFNEAATVSGSLGFGASDGDPDSFEIDEPGYIFGDIFDNLLLGSLDNTNAITASFPDDVSLALGFTLGDLPSFAGATITILLSDDGDSIGSLALDHYDTDPFSPDHLTISGNAQTTAVPEPSTFVMFSMLLLALPFLTRRHKRPSPATPSATTATHR
jgi:hypothetical protein